MKEKYGQAALRVTTGGTSCCGASLALDRCDPITSNLYDATQTSELPDQAVKASLGCGNPTALAQLNRGETVLDLGSGGGIDVLLSARRVRSKTSPPQIPSTSSFPIASSTSPPTKITCCGKPSAY